MTHFVQTQDEEEGARKRNAKDQIFRQEELLPGGVLVSVACVEFRGCLHSGQSRCHACEEKQEDLDGFRFDRTGGRSNPAGFIGDFGTFRGDG
jgi:hypothetical protein